jgi:hypothetical protein
MDSKYRATLLSYGNKASIRPVLGYRISTSIEKNKNTSKHPPCPYAKFATSYHAKTCSTLPWPCKGSRPTHRAVDDIEHVQKLRRVKMQRMVDSRLANRYIAR